MEPIKVPDMMCEGCVALITDLVGKMDGVESVNVDLEGRLVTVAGSANRPDVIEALKGAGYQPE